MQLQPVRKAKKKGGGLASWLGGLQVVKSSSGKSYAEKQRLSGSGSGYDYGEAIGYGKDTISSKLSRVKG